MPTPATYTEDDIRASKIYPMDFLLPMGNIWTGRSSQYQLITTLSESEMDIPPPFDPSPWLPFESRRRARDEKREAVLRTAVQLFLEQGYHRATLNEVAERLNITKPALYNYFRGKDEILFECWAMGQERVDDFIAGINAEGGNGLVKLRKLVRAYGEVMATDFGASLVRFDVRDLSDKNADIVRAAKRSIDHTFRGYITEGVSDGSIKPCD